MWKHYYRSSIGENVSHNLHGSTITEFATRRSVTCCVWQDKIPTPSWKKSWVFQRCVDNLIRYQSASVAAHKTYQVNCSRPRLIVAHKHRHEGIRWRSRERIEKYPRRSLIDTTITRWGGKHQHLCSRSSRRNSPTICLICRHCCQTAWIINGERSRTQQNSINMWS